MAEFLLSSLFSSIDTRRIAAAAGIAAAGILVFWLVRGRLKPGNCAQCRHDLRGIAGDRCPECGLEIAATAAKIAARARTRRRAIVVGITLALAAGLVYLFAESVTTWIKWAAAASMTDRELAAQSMRFDGSDARMALKERADAIAAGERTVDGSLSDPAAIRAVINQPMKHRIAPIAPTGKPDPHTMQELDGRAREACELRYRAGLSPSQVGAVLGLQANTASKLLHRLRERLRECIERKHRQEARA